MSKQRPDPDKVANELMGGASAFFRGSAPAHASQTPAAPTQPTPAPASIPDSTANHDVITSRRHDAVTSLNDEAVGFDITRETASRDSLRLSIDETKALDAMRSSLKWDYDLTVSKNDICRVALHWLLEDFRAKGERSQAVGRLRKKSAGR